MTGREPAGFVAAAVSLFGIGLTCAAVGGQSALGCMTHQCDSSFQCVFPNTYVESDGSGNAAPLRCGGGAAVIRLTADQVYQSGDELVWDSGPFNGDWLAFGGATTLSIYYPPRMHSVLVAQGANALPTSVLAWVSPDAADAADVPEAGSLVRNFANAAGQLADYVSMDQSAVTVSNSSCAYYSLRLEVRVQLGPADDAGTAAMAASDSRPE